VAGTGGAGVAGVGGGVAGSVGAAGTGGSGGATGGTGGAPTLTVVINEVTPVMPDYIELFNTTAGDVDISGWTVTDSAPQTAGHTYTFPAATIVPAGGYVALDGEMVDFDFGLGGGDSVILNNATGTQIDIYTWTSAPTGGYSRCPNGTGAFTARPLTANGMPNNCP
jgi:hypothetical protein